jgi:DegV family protein with EDD domain
MFSSSTLPKTSQPSPSAFCEAFKGISSEDEILCLTISSGLSGTYQSACLGSELSERKVTVFDTLSGSLAHGLMLLEAARLVADCLPLNEILEKLKICRSNMNILILLDTLENIVKGGRLSRFKGSIAKILDIKILLEGIEGKVEIKGKIRGKKRFYERTLEIIGERVNDFSEVIFGITHADNHEDAEFLRTELNRRYKPKDVLINYMGSSMGTYAGKGGLIISFLSN